MTDWLVVPAFVAIWLLYRIAQSIENVQSTLLDRLRELPETDDTEGDELTAALESGDRSAMTNLANKWRNSSSSADSPPPLGQDSQDTWLEPFAFSLYELALQRAYLECIVQYSLQCMADETRATGVDCLEAQAEAKLARRFLATMMQANQQVRYGSLSATEARDSILGERPLPIGSSPKTSLASRLGSSAFDTVNHDGLGLLQRLRSEGLNVFSGQFGRPSREASERRESKE